jgi:hypothetical protein
MKKRLSKLGLTMVLSYGLVITNIEAENAISVILNSSPPLYETIDKEIDLYLKNPQKSIDEVTSELVAKHQVGKRLALRKYFKKNMMNTPDKMSRKGIKKAPLFFRNTVEDSKLILKFLKRYLDRTAHAKFTNYMRRLSFPKPSNEQSRFINNYDKLDMCIDKFTDSYFEHFQFINEKYINNLSKDEQDKLYIMSGVNALSLGELSKECMVDFNEVLDSYNVLLPLR